MKVRCKSIVPIDERDHTYPHLTLGNIYSVIDEGTKSAYRIINNEGDPCIYGSRRFDIVDNTMDDDWIVETDDKGDLIYFYSKELMQYEHLYEDYHDDKLEAIMAFDDYVLRKFRKEHGELEGLINHPQHQKPRESMQYTLKKYSNETMRDAMTQAFKRYDNLTIMDVRCLDSRPTDQDKPEYPDITEGNVYFVLGSEGDFYRIIGDSGKPYLYHKSRFELVELEKGLDWAREIDTIVGEILYPPGLTPSVFEESFFYDLKAREEISMYAYKIYKRKQEKIYDARLSIPIVQHFESGKKSDGKQA